MRNIIGLAVVLCLASGLIGAFVVNGLSGEAGAAPGCPPKCPTPSATASPTPAPPQPREAVISIIAGTAVDITGPPAGTWIEVDAVSYFRLPLDASHYPANTAFRLGLAGGYGNSFPAVPVCLRLSEVVAGGLTAVAGSDACVSANPGPFSVSSPTFSLPSGSHTYTLQVSGASRLLTTGARIIAEWTE